MKVIFTRDVPNVASAGEVKEVAAGFARNFLFTRRLASPATPDVIKALEAREQKRREKQEKKFQQVRTLAKKLEFMKIKIRAKSNKEGKLFAAIHAREIVQELAGKKYFIDPHFITLEKSIKTVGEHKVTIRAGSETFGQITLEVVGETS